LVFAGRLDPQKGLLGLIDVMRSLSLEDSNVNLLILGDGPQRAEMEKAVRDGNLSDRVLLRGLVQDVAMYLRAGDIFVFPSVGEGMPNALLEAMATGLPCVAWAIGGCTDLIVDRETGLLVPPGDVSAFREALEMLIRSPEARERLGAAARRDAVSRFGLERMVDLYAACYRAVVAGHPVAAISGENLSERP
jgi:glycosyltransferase involved in cell wall biosynthesis